MIKLKKIERTFPVGDEKVYALQNVSLNIKAGEYISIMGPSGSGKSTLLNTIGLLDRPNSGIYLLEGTEVTQLNDDQQAQIRRERIGFVFQFFHLVPRLSAAENIELPLTLSGINHTERLTRVDEMLKTLGIGDRALHRPDQLSGGQRQKVAIARAAVNNPAVLLADEPTGNLDRAAGNDVIEILEKLNSNGLTLIMVTHDPVLGKRARRKIRMEDGQITGDTTHDENG